VEGPSITYIYKCKNRKCQRFRQKTELPFSPTEHVSRTNELPRCDQCQETLKFVRMHYPKQVFSGPAAQVDFSISESELSNIIKTAAKTVDDKEGRGRSS
jgi:hypothetical protein